ncbi:MAG TPA: AI-2E family transporter [Rhizomicrobium sp.]|nr:AI-2E family transporter [Rhizomicrobium sp.]
MKVSSQNVTNWLVSLLAILVLMAVGREFFVPLVFALLMWAVLNAIVGFLHRMRVPGWLAWAAAFLLIGLSLWFFAVVLIGQAAAIVAAGPHDIGRLEQMWRANVPIPVSLPMPDVDHLLRDERVAGFLTSTAASAGGVLLDLALVIVYVGFLIAEQDHIPEKIARLQQDGSEKEGEQVVRAISHQVQAYLGVCTLASVVMAIVTYALLSVMHVDFAAFWALAMFFITYIPTVGGIAVLLPALMALAQFGSPGPAIVIAAVLFATHFVLTNVVETLMLGRTLDLSPFAIILSLTFWGLVWGVGGLFLAVPLTGALGIVCQHIEGLEWIAQLLAGSHRTRARRKLRFGIRRSPAPP